MRQRKWVELIKDYDPEIHYHSGKANVVADALSRYPLTLNAMIKERLPAMLPSAIIASKSKPSTKDLPDYCKHFGVHTSP